MMPKNSSMISIAFRICALVILFVILNISSAVAQIPCVRGYVRDAGGNPVADADLDFDDAITGERIYTPGDNTDQDGFYTVCVLPGIYNISYAPPAGTHLLGSQHFNVDLTSGQDTLINVTLGFGVVISGVLTDSSGGPVGEVDFDADVISTGERIYTPNDNSDSLTGAYWVVVPPETYRLRYQPPAGTRWLGMQLDSVPVFADTVIDLILEEGFLLSGHVTDSLGAGLEEITIDLRDAASGRKIYIPNDKSDSTGFYDAAVPGGLFQLRYEPPIGSRLVGAAIDSFAIATDISRDQILYSGWLLTVFVHDSTGRPIESADLDVIRESTGEKLFTPHDKTDSLGLATVAIPPDTFMVRVQPPIGTIFDQVVLHGVVISEDTALDFTLPEVQRVSLSGRITDSLGTGLPQIVIDLVSPATGEIVFVDNNVTDSLGGYDLAVPIGTFDMEIKPPRGSRYVAAKFTDVVFDADTTWDDIALESGFIFSAAVFDLQADPVAGADFDFILDSNGVELFTPHDNTDGEGAAMVTVPGGIYTIRLSPPPSSSYDQQHLSGYDLHSDTLETFILKRSSESPPEDFILKQNAPNPFNEVTSIHYLMLQSDDVSLKIYNSLGQLVKEFDLGPQSDGYYAIEWNGTDNNGARVASGIYFYRLITGHGKKTRQMLLIK